MDADGSGFQTVQRTSGTAAAGVGERNSASLQVVGDKVYYSFMEEPRVTAEEQLKRSDKDWGKVTGNEGMTMWTASANLDGSRWKAIQRTTAPPDVDPGYRGVSVVGESVTTPRWRN